MRSLGRSCSVMLVLALVALSLASGLHAQDSTSVQDHTGPFGAAIDYYFPIAVTFLQSLIVKGLTAISPAFQKLGTPVKWGALFVVGLVVYKVAGLAGFAMANADAHTWTTTGVLSAVGTVVAGLIYRFGGRKVETA